MPKCIDCKEEFDLEDYDDVPVQNKLRCVYCQADREEEKEARQTHVRSSLDKLFKSKENRK